MQWFPMKRDISETEKLLLATTSWIFPEGWAAPALGGTRKG